MAIESLMYFYAPMLTALYFCAIFWAWCAPSPPLERRYFRAFFCITVVLETMERIPATNQWTRIYFWIYWIVVAYISVSWPALLFYSRKSAMFRAPRVALTAIWFYMCIYYIGYFADWHSTRLDKVPMILYTLGFLMYGQWARAVWPKKRKTARSGNILTLRPSPPESRAYSRSLL